jgi:hypothetical protein
MSPISIQSPLLVRRLLEQELNPWLNETGDLRSKHLAADAYFHFWYIVIYWVLFYFVWIVKHELPDLPTRNERDSLIEPS